MLKPGVLKDLIGVCGNAGDAIVAIDGRLLLAAAWEGVEAVGVIEVVAAGAFRGAGAGVAVMDTAVCSELRTCEAELVKFWAMIWCLIVDLAGVEGVWYAAGEVAKNINNSAPHSPSSWEEMNLFGVDNTDGGLRELL